MNANRKYLWLLLLLCPAPAVVSRADDSPSAMAAEAEHQQQWQREDLTASEVVALACRWIRTCTQCALEAPPTQREAWWQKATEIATQLDRRMPEAPRRLLVDVQLALAEFARGDLLREEAGRQIALPEIGPARDALRSAIRQLEQTDAAAQRLLRSLYNRPTRKPADGQWTTRQLESLRRNLTLQLARALRSQALCYPGGSADRINALDRALVRLRDLIGRSEKDQLTWQARFETLVCLRQMGQPGVAARRLAKWDEDCPPAMRSRLAAERLRILLAQGHIGQALAQATAMRTTGPEPRDPEADLAILEVLLAAGRAASGTESSASTQPAESAESRRLWQLAAEQARQLGQQHGPYWERRGQLLLGRQLPLSAELGDAKLLAKTAATLFADGNPQKALAAYDRAAALAGKADDAVQQFELARTAAAIARQLGNDSDAMDRYRRLALEQKDHPQAAGAHLTAVGLAAQAVRNTPATEQQAAWKSYSALLDEHLRHWPQGEQADTARWWKGRLHRQRGQWHEAATTLGGITPESRHYDEAVAMALDCCREYLGSVELGKKDQTTASGEDAARQKALGELMLELLDAASDGEDAKHGANRQGADEETAAANRELLRAAAYRLLGRRADAMEIYRRLAGTSSDDGRLLEAYAALLSEGSSPSDWREGLQQWQKIENRSRPAGPRWWRARRARIGLLVHLGEQEAARKLVQLTVVVHPDERESLERLLP